MFHLDLFVPPTIRANDTELRWTILKKKEKLKTNQSRPETKTKLAEESMVLEEKEEKEEAIKNDEIMLLKDEQKLNSDFLNLVQQSDGDLDSQVDLVESLNELEDSEGKRMAWTLGLIHTSADSVVDCIKAEFGIILSLCINATIQFGIRRPLRLV